jgi:ATP-binding cassette subfamily F protein uup
LNTVFNYFDQEKAQFKTSKSLLEFIAQKKDRIAFGNQRLHQIAYLRRFLFHTREEWEKSVNDLSGGQLTRLGLAKLFQTAANFLLLDEPTNDLDVDNLEVLERSLREFTGCVILTSHDRFFLDKVCTHTLFLQGDGYHILSTGNYTEFINKYGGEYFQIMDQQRGLTQSINDISKEETKTSSKKQSKKWSPAQKKREQNKIRKKQETVEVEIESLEKEIKDFQFKFMEPDFYSRNRGRIEELQEKLQTQEKELQKKYEQWEKLEQKVQELEG